MSSVSSGRGYVRVEFSQERRLGEDASRTGVCRGRTMKTVKYKSNFLLACRVGTTDYPLPVFFFFFGGLVQKTHPGFL